MNRHISAALVCFIFFILISLYVTVVGEPNVFGNASILQSINSNNVEALTPIMVFFAEYGREHIWIPVAILLWIFGGDKGKRCAFLISLAFVITAIMGAVFKDLIGQPRPTSTYVFHILVSEGGYSYPSANALMVVTGATLALMTLPYYLSLPLTAEALLVSYSRVYVGVHWPVDIMAGGILGISIALLIIGLESRISPVYIRLRDAWNRLV